MSTPTINGHRHPVAATPITHSDVRARAPRPEPRPQASGAPDPPESPARPRAISRIKAKLQAHRFGNFLRPHLAEARDTLTTGWALTSQLPTPADAAKKLLRPGSRWFWWPIDIPANLLALAGIFLLHLTCQALDTQRRRRVAYALTLTALAVTTITRLIAA